MFGEVDKLDLEELETPATKQMRVQAATAEEADIVLKEGPIPEDGTTQVGNSYPGACSSRIRSSTGHVSSVRPSKGNQ